LEKYPQVYTIREKKPYEVFLALLVVKTK
jgi:hypothetical protein